jgi:hypothetical protein
MLSAILYDYWLTARVLDYFSLNQWRLIGVSVAVLVASIWPVLKWNVSTLLVGCIVGISLCGTWLEWRIQEVRPASVWSSFLSYLGNLGSQVVIVGIAVTMTGCCSTQIIKSIESRKHARNGGA